MSHADARHLAHLGAQPTKLKRIKETIDRRDIGGAPHQIGASQAEVHVRDEPVQASVARDVIRVLAQGSPALAPDFVSAFQEVVEAIEAIDPLGCGLGADPGHARQVVGGLADDRRDLGVAMRRHPVLGLDRFGSHAPQVPGSCPRVEHGDVLGHRLEGVAVAGDDQHRSALVTGLVGQRRQDVVGLESLSRQRHDPHRVQDLAYEFHLPLKLFRRRISGSLVLRVLLGAE